MLKRIFVIGIVVSLLTSTCIFASAESADDITAIPEENAVYVSGTNSFASNSVSDQNQYSESICTLDSEGNITQSIFSPSTNQLYSNNNADFDLGEFNPNVENTLAVGASITEDPYGRIEMDPVDKRVGVLLCGFNTDNDDEIEEYKYGTASLQNYDILVSCAHVLWKPQYAHLEKEGWASDITFYAGRNGHNRYASKSNYSHASISMSFINNSSYYVNDQGDIVTTYEFNYDWSIITIKDNLGGKYGWFGLHGCSEIETGMEIYTIGYPGDKDAYTQWRAPGTITSFNGNKMIYDAYIVGGNSGGPILNDGYLYGIATYHTYNSTTPWLNSGGTRMYDNLFSMIVGAREDSAERWG